MTIGTLGNKIKLEGGGKMELFSLVFVFLGLLLKGLVKLTYWLVKGIGFIIVTVYLSIKSICRKGKAITKQHANIKIQKRYCEKLEERIVV